MKNKLKTILKVCGRILLTILILLVVTITALSIRHHIKCKSDREFFKDAYGTYYTLQTGEKINYTFYDSQSEEVAVILPGFGSSSVHYEFDTFAKELSDKYKIIIYEPLGYGLSDGTTRERTAENYCNELHELMSSLGYSEYTLIGHSISGIYALEYSKLYPDEMKAFIGIDSSVPHQDEIVQDSASSANMPKSYKAMDLILNKTGIYRLQMELTKEETFSAIPTLNKVDRKKALAMNSTNVLGDTQMNELESLHDNMKTTYDMKFPEDMPVLYLLSDDTCTTVPLWEQEHEKLITNPNGKVVRLNGTHYLHLTNLDEVITNIEEWNPEQETN